MSIQRRQPVRKRRREGPRRGPMRDPAYLQFLREEGRSVVSGGRGCDPAHGPVNGMSSKGPDDGAIPLTREEHEEQTRIGWTDFESKYGFRREDEAKVWRAAFLIYQEHGR